MLFATKGPAPGAIVVEWNVNSPQQGGAGMWDSYIRYVEWCIGYHDSPNNLCDYRLGGGKLSDIFRQDFETADLTRMFSCGY